MWKMKRYLVLVLIPSLCGLFAIYSLSDSSHGGSRHPHSHVRLSAAQLLRKEIFTAREKGDTAHDSLPARGRDVPPGSADTLLAGGNRNGSGTVAGRDSTDHGRGGGGVESAGLVLERGGSAGLESEGGGSSGGSPKPLLRILVLTYRRAQSLQRCLDSLNAAEYDGLPAAVEIHVDRGRDERVHNDTLNVARAFGFRHGRVQVFVRPRHGGVVGQWLGSWRVPRDNASEIALFLEDDLTVSSYFSRWLRRVHAKYDGFPGVNGYTLQGETIRHAEGTDYSLMEGPPGEHVFLYPIVGSWGFSPNTGHWREFLRWYRKASQDPKFLPLVPGLKPSGWYHSFYKSGRTETMWTMWHIYHATQNHQYTLYPHFAQRKGLAFNWKEPGEHYSKSLMGKGLKAHLLDSWNEADVQLPEQLVIVDSKGTITGQKLTRSGLV